jgi:signal peptidase I, bacterial type
MEPFTPPSGPLTWIETLARLPIATVVLAMAVCTVIRLIVAPMQNRPARFVNNLLDAVIYAGILVYLIIRPYVAQPFYIPSESMVPTLKVGDVVMVGKYSYRFSEPKRFDIVVFRAPDWALNPWQTPGKTDFVKRLIGLPGDIIEVRAGEGLYLNGKLLNEPYLKETPKYSMKVINGWVYTLEYGTFGGIQRTKGGENTISLTVTSDEERRMVLSTPSQPIPKGKYLMLGDNRNNSSDGHHWGLLDAKRVVGKALFVFWPLNRIGPANRSELPKVE